MGAASDGHAQSRAEIAVDGSIFLSDNPFLIPGVDLSSSAVEVAAAPSAKLDIGHATSLDLDGVVRFRKYQRLYGDFVTGRAQAMVRHRDSERLSLRAGVSFTRDLPTDALTGTLDSAIDTQTIREAITAEGYVDWKPRATWTVDAGANVTRTRNPGSIMLPTNRDSTFTVGAAKQISSRTAVGLRGTASFSDGSAAGNRSAQSIQATLRQDFSTGLQANLQGGVEFAREASLPGTPRNDLKPRFTGAASICKQNSRLDLCLNASLRSESSSLNGLQREWAVGTTGELTVSERGQVTARAEYRERVGGTIPLKFLHAKAEYQHRLDQRYRLSAGVDYLRRGGWVGKSIGATIVHVTLTVGLR